jgi:hypothetical protein
MTLAQVVAAIRALPRERRGQVVRDLVDAAASRIAGGESFTVFDPLECTPDIGGLCPHRVRHLASEDRVCLAWIDPAVTCPHAKG